MPEEKNAEGGTVAAAPVAASDARRRLTEAEYLEELHHLDNEVDGVIDIFQTNEEIRRLALEDATIYQTINRDPLFWNIHRSCLQTSLFIVLARIFDPAPDAHSIQKLISATIAQPELFSKAALTIRRSKGGTKPDWLDGFIQTAWEPKSSGELRHLRKELTKYTHIFTKVYQPIRHNVVAHRLVTNDEDVAALFAQTNREEVGQILAFLADLIHVLFNLFQNGVEPKLGQHPESHDSRNESVRETVRKVLSKLAKAPTA